MPICGWSKYLEKEALKFQLEWVKYHRNWKNSKANEYQRQAQKVFIIYNFSRFKIEINQFRLMMKQDRVELKNDDSKSTHRG